MDKDETGLRRLRRDLIEALVFAGVADREYLQSRTADELDEQFCAVEIYQQITRGELRRVILSNGRIVLMTADEIAELPAVEE
jgi:hypothetical protein